MSDYVTKGDGMNNRLDAKRRWRENHRRERQEEHYYLSRMESVSFAAMCVITSMVICLIILFFAAAAHAEQYSSEDICDAIYVIEGGARAKQPYGILSVPCEGIDECRQICLNTVENHFIRWQALENSGGDFLLSLARRYAPIGAKNDPKGLNKHWYRNLLAVLR